MTKIHVTTAVAAVAFMLVLGACAPEAKLASDTIAALDTPAGKALVAGVLAAEPKFKSAIDALETTLGSKATGNVKKWACAGVSYADGEFKLIEGSIKLPSSVIAKEKAAFAGADAFCADDTTTTVATVKAIGNAYDKIRAALKDAGA